MNKTCDSYQGNRDGEKEGAGCEEKKRNYQDAFKHPDNLKNVSVPLRCSWGTQRWISFKCFEMLFQVKLSAVFITLCSLSLGPAKVFLLVQGNLNDFEFVKAIYDCRER